jgi:acetoin utilization deacetylase AcuC-like enzyme
VKRHWRSKFAAMQRPVFVYHAEQEFSIGAHVFPIEKYARARERLLAEGDTTPEDWREAPLATREELALVHTPEYLDDFFACRMTPRTAASEFPLTPEIVRGFTRMAGGTIVASREALTRGLAVNVGGGFHHAFPDHAEGFCYLNDLAVALRVLLAEGRIARAAVIDLDLHQGNGTARIFEDDPRVYTFSMHQERLYPVKETSTLDLGLDEFIGDERYLALLADALPRVLERARPDFVLYQAGADPYEHDMLGALGLSKRGLAERDRRVLEACAARSLPCAITFGGGYASNPEDTVDIHVATCRAALAQSGSLRSA